MRKSDIFTLNSSDLITKYIFHKDVNVEHLSIRDRILLSPIMFIYLCVVTLLLTSFAGPGVVLGGLFIFIDSLIIKEDVWFGLLLILLPFVSPFIWLFRYIKFGEYSIIRFR